MKIGTGAVAVTIFAVAGIWGSGTGASAAVQAPPIDPAEFANTVSTDAVMDHLEALEQIAIDNGGNRAFGTPGYTASADYIEPLLQEAGYVTTRQPFDTPLQTILAYELSLKGVPYLPPIGVPMQGTTGTGPTAITTTLVRPVDPAVAGCAAADYAGVDATGHISIVNRGNCTFADKSAAAAAAGAAALIIVNNEDAPFLGDLGPAGTTPRVPTIGVSSSEGSAIGSIGDVPLGFLLDETTQTISTFNLLAESPTGRDDNTVMAGAHLDSVKEGPGINDNGSGSAVLLETALQLAEQGDLNNQVRFAWWGGEEEGLLGSFHYVSDLVANAPTEVDQIATYLNFDMVGSPNYVMAVYDADQSSSPAPVEVPPGSVATEKLLTDYLDSIGQPWKDTAFDGRSDYLPFITAGVASSGLFTGAEGIKSPEEAARFGGTAGQQYDPNYHQAGDTVANISETALGIASRAIAFAIGSLANDTSLINGVTPETAPIESVAPVAALPTSPIPSSTLLR